MDTSVVSLIIVLIGVVFYALYKAYLTLPPDVKTGITDVLKNLKKGAKAYPYLVSIFKIWNIDVNEGWEKAFDLLKKELEKRGIKLSDEDWVRIGKEIKKQWYKIYKEITGEEWEENTDF